VKVSEQNSADPGGKNTPFPAWVLRYASQPAPLPSPSPAGLDAESAEEQNYTELNNFKDAEPAEPSDSGPAKDEASAE
jgi:hypothetical protein